MKENNRPIIIWLFIGVLMIAAMVIIGGITRLTESGLSMVDWRLVAGTFPPLTEVEWNRVFSDYQKSPEFKELNSNFTLSDFKSIFWWEYIHRLWGRIIGLVFIFPLAWFVFKKMIPKRLVGKLIAIFILGAFQGFLGWFMVKSGLVNEPRVSHYRLAAHLTTAFLAFAFTFWVAIDLLKPVAKINEDLKKIHIWLKVFFPILILQIIYGAFVAGMDAGTVHNNFPKMENDAWVSEAVFALNPTWLNFIEAKSGVQFIHRYVAYFVSGLVFFIWFKLGKGELSKTQQLARNLFLSALIFQFFLGVFTLLYSVPIVLGVLHQFGALLVLAASVFLAQQLRFFKPN
jgi:heme a synthase